MLLHARRLGQFSSTPRYCSHQTPFALLEVSFLCRAQETPALVQSSHFLVPPHGLVADPTPPALVDLLEGAHALCTVLPPPRRICMDTCLTPRIWSLGYLSPKSFVPLGLLANTSQTRLTHDRCPLCRTMVSSTTPDFGRSGHFSGNSHITQCALSRRGKQALCCQSERPKYAPTAINTREARSHLDRARRPPHSTLPSVRAFKIEMGTGSVGPRQLPWSVSAERVPGTESSQTRVLRPRVCVHLSDVNSGHQRTVDLGVCLRGQRMFHAPPADTCNAFLVQLQRRTVAAFKKGEVPEALSRLGPRFLVLGAFVLGERPRRRTPSLDCSGR